MRLVVIGVNHKTAPVALRERLAFVGEDLNTALVQLKAFTDGSVIVSTCNRTEIYALMPLMPVSSDKPAQATYYQPHNAQPHNAQANNAQPQNSQSHNSQTLNPRDNLSQSSHTQGNNFQSTNFQSTSVQSNSNAAMNAHISNIKQWLAEFKQLQLDDIDPYLYVHRDTHAITHWLRVAAGLDSMILGEPQILGQIKQAVQLAQSESALSGQMSWIIDHVFAASKRVRNETSVGAHAVSLGFAAAKLVTQIFDNLPSRTLLVVAAGEMNRLVATHIAGLGVGRVMICNRSPERAEILAEGLRQPNRQVEVYPLHELPQLLAEADIISSCSGSVDMLIDKNMTVQALKRRRYQPMLMIDLAVPRDIDPTISRIDDVYLYSVDDLQHVIAGNLEQRRQAAVDAELLVSQLVVEMERRFQVRQVGHDIQQYRSRTQQQVEALLSISLTELERGEMSHEQVITELSRRLTQTLNHAPSKLMRKAAREGDSDLLNFVVSGLKDAYRRRR